MKRTLHLIIAAFIAFVSCMLYHNGASGCTSMIVSSPMTEDGMAMLWKHRDTDNPHNFVERVMPARRGDNTLAYMALFNGGDSLLSEAWAGFNEAGFAIVNTASYNLAPDTAGYKDREGRVMTEALLHCRTVDDFGRMLDSLPKPLGVQANFGVLDSSGSGAYFETDDYRYTRFDLEMPDGTYVDSINVKGILTRTNYSMSGDPRGGYGYIRYRNALHILSDDIAQKKLSPLSFTEKASRSFWHSLMGRDMAEQGHPPYVPDQDFIPRSITSASVVIEVASPGSDYPTTMWVMIGYTPCSYVLPVTIDSVPDELRPTEPGWRCKLANEVYQRRSQAFPLHKANGQRYIHMDYIDSVSPSLRAQSLHNYLEHKARYLKPGTGLNRN